MSRKAIAGLAGCSPSNVNTHLTRIFQKYIEAQETIVENYPLFAGRMKKHSDKVGELEKQIRKHHRSARR